MEVILQRLINSFFFAVAFMMPQFLPESKESSNAICAKLKNPDLSNDEVILPENQTIVLQIEGTNTKGSGMEVRSKQTSDCAKSVG